MTADSPLMSSAIRKAKRPNSVRERRQWVNSFPSNEPGEFLRRSPARRRLTGALLDSARNGRATGPFRCPLGQAINDSDQSNRVPRLYPFVGSRKSRAFNV